MFFSVMHGLVMRKYFLVTEFFFSVSKIVFLSHAKKISHAKKNQSCKRYFCHAKCFHKFFFSVIKTVF
jgi:hypothetical protein